MDAVVANQHDDLKPTNMRIFWVEMYVDKHT